MGCDMKIWKLAVLPLAGVAFSAPAWATPEEVIGTVKAANPTAAVLHYDNKDVTKVTTTTIRTPNYVTVTTPVYKTVSQPVYNAAGKLIGYKSVQVQTGTVTTQKLVGYTTTVKKDAVITPASRIYTATTGTTAAPVAAIANINLPTYRNTTAPVTGKQNALLTISAVSNASPVLSGYTFSQPVGSGYIQISLAKSVRAVNAAGKAYGSALTNLLRITFNNAVLTGDTRTNLWTLSSDDKIGGLTFSSSFFDTSYATNSSSYSFEFDGLASKLGIAPLTATYNSVTGSPSLSSFTSTLKGSISAAVPEPATWAMMIVGFGLIAATMRRRRVETLASMA